MSSQPLVRWFVSPVPEPLFREELRYAENFGDMSVPADSGIFGVVSISSEELLRWLWLWWLSLSPDLDVARSSPVILEVVANMDSSM